MQFSPGAAPETSEWHQGVKSCISRVRYNGHLQSEQAQRSSQHMLLLSPAACASEHLPFCRLCQSCVLHESLPFQFMMHAQCMPCMLCISIRTPDSCTVYNPGHVQSARGDPGHMRVIQTTIRGKLAAISVTHNELPVNCMKGCRCAMHWVRTAAHGFDLKSPRSIRMHQFSRAPTIMRTGRKWGYPGTGMTSKSGQRLTKRDC
jgi:hypothetical protein